jgi:sulfate adenylyltransferase subunit 2
MATVPQELPSATPLQRGQDFSDQPAAQTQLSHLKALEAESIYILREAAAEFSRPVMLYSIGKDSSVMLRLAQKASFPPSSRRHQL